MEHSVDLSAHHFIWEVSPSTGRTLINKINFDNEGGNVDDSCDDTPMVVGDSTNGIILDIADSVGKALALVKQVCTMICQYCHVVLMVTT
jgi:hypothetical protein